MEYGSDFGIQRVQFLGGDQAASDSLKQRESDALLGVSDELAHRRLADAEQSRGPADRAGLQHRVEDFKMPQVHFTHNLWL
jgi:hypothetical protein